MTTYNGRSASYEAGREVINKEPSVSKYVIEKLYRVHRERVLNVKPTIESHITIPDFLMNQSWKKNAERQRALAIMRTNRSLYNRLAKVEASESNLTKENKGHIKRMEAKMNYLTKLKEHGRLVSLIKIQKENEYMLRRIEKAKPEYTMKECKEWYKYHQVYKSGRRSDPTGGHIMHGLKHLMPSTLPPLSGSQSSPSLDSALKSNRQLLPSLNSISASTMKSSMTLSQPSSAPSQYSNSITSVSTSNAVHRNKQLPRVQMIGFYDRKPIIESEEEERGMNEEEDDERFIGGRSMDMDGQHGHHPHHSHSHHRGGGSGEQQSNPTTPHNASSLNLTRSSYMNFEYREEGGSDEEGSQPPGGDVEERYGELAENDDSQQEQQGQGQGQEGKEDLMLLSSRPFAIPFDSKNCLVQIYSSRSYDENLYLKVITAGLSSKIVAERSLTIDKAYEIINSGGHSSQIIHSTDNEDLQSLSALLCGMFEEADDDGSGSLTFDEFQQLMEQVELGISPQELRFVISEADENENGVVDYEEFVPLAVDLIQSFRARNRAKALNSQTDVMIDDQIMKSISTEELEETARQCLEKIFEFDSKKYGLIRVQDLKRCLHGVNKVNEAEINMLCQMLPRDQFGRVKYNTTSNAFLDTLSKVRFMTMKNTLIESQGSGLQKYLLDLCREEEARLEHFEGHMEKFVPSGIIPCRSLINILSNSSRLSLSRLQVLVIMSEASVLDGMINYFQFIPVVAKAIEIMFEPKALRQRAELIEKTDLSPEALLAGMSSPEMFAQRLSTLFKSYDIDHNSRLDQNEFIACLESLDFHLTYDEMVNLMTNVADLDQKGYLEFPDFVSFFKNNLLHLEKEKRIRLLQSSIHHHGGNGSANGDQDDRKKENNNNKNHPHTSGGENSLNSTTNMSLSRGSGGANNSNNNNPNDANNSNEESLMDRLLGIFKLSDPENLGQIPIEEFQSIMQNFSVHSSHFLTDVLLSELHVTDDGMIDYQKSLNTCSELLKVFQAKESALYAHKERELWAEEKAMTILQASASEINHIVRYIRHKLKKIAEKACDVMTRFLDIQEAIRSPQSGLSRSESNMVLSKLFYGLIQPSGSRSIENSPKHIHDVPSFVWSKSGGFTSSEKDGTTKPSTPNSTTALGGGGISPLKPLPSISSIRSSQQFRENLKSLRYQFTTEELFDAVFEARKVTVMRSLLQETDRTQLYRLIQNILQKELTERQAHGEISSDNHYLPVKVCFHTLENCEALHLNRAQVMFIISWAECFDREGLALDIYKFAEHAASIIDRLHLPEVMETRASVINQATIDDKKALNGLKEKDLIHYLETGMTRYLEDDGSSITLDNLRIVLHELPRVKLSDRDIATIIAGLTLNEDGNSIDAQEQLLICMGLVRSLCRERTIHRRLSLVVTSSMPDLQQGITPEAKRIQEESLENLKQLAEKLLNYVKIVMQGDSMLINLPIDTLQRRSSQLLEDGYKTEHHAITLVYRGARFLPFHTIRFVLVAEVENSLSSSSSSTSPSRDGSLLIGRKHNTASRDFSAVMTNPKPIVQTETIKTTKAAFLQLLLVEDKRLYSGSSLICNITFLDGQTLCVDNLPIKMPSAGLVDTEAAEQFAANLVETFYLELTDGCDQPTLKMNN